MASEPSRKVAELIERALRLEPESREAFLASACPDDASALAEARAMLPALAASTLVDASATAGESPPIVPATYTHDGYWDEPDPQGRVGSVIDGVYRIEALLGRGGMGIVYRARHTLLNDDVAIKFLPRDVAGDPLWRERFHREGRAARLFRHPGAVVVHDLRSTAGGEAYLVFEFVEGHTLREELKRRTRFALADAVAVIETIAGVLDAAHAHGVVHRDLKPENIMIRPEADGSLAVRVLDFGLAKLAGPPVRSEWLERPTGSDSATENLTQPGAMPGTPVYMSPEQWGERPADGAAEVDGRTDVYSLGLVAYELLVGTMPFPVVSLDDLRFHHLHTVPERVDAFVEGLPASVAEAIARALSKDRRDRQATAGQFAAELRTGVATAQESPPAPKRSLAAYQAYLRGRFHWYKRVPDEVKKAIDRFNEAIDLDPHYAAAFAGLADAHIYLGFLESSPPHSVYPVARAAAVRALELDASLAEAHSSLGFIETYYEWNWETAEGRFRRSLELDAGYALGHHWYGLHLMSRGRFELASEALGRAQELEPLALIMLTALGFPFYFSGRYERALEVYDSVLELERHFVPVHLYRGLAYEQLGALPEAIAAFQEALHLAPAVCMSKVALAHAHALSGDEATALEILDELIALSATRYVSPYGIAIVYAGLARRDEAFAWLDRACDDRSSWLPYCHVDPRLSSLREDPRFGDLTRRVGV